MKSTAKKTMDRKTPKRRPHWKCNGTNRVKKQQKEGSEITWNSNETGMISFISNVVLKYSDGWSTVIIYRDDTLIYQSTAGYRLKHRSRIKLEESETLKRNTEELFSIIAKTSRN